MKIINKKPHKSVVIKIICDNCGISLEYVPKDVKQEKTHVGYHFNNTYQSITYSFIRCPECKTKLEVN